MRFLIIITTSILSMTLIVNGTDSANGLNYCEYNLVSINGGSIDSKKEGMLIIKPKNDKIAIISYRIRTIDSDELVVGEMYGYAKVSNGDSRKYRWTGTLRGQFTLKSGSKASSYTLPVTMDLEIYDQKLVLLRKIGHDTGETISVYKFTR
jgi:hypothetical protein